MYLMIDLELRNKIVYYRVSLAHHRALEDMSMQHVTQRYSQHFEVQASHTSRGIDCTRSIQRGPIGRPNHCAD